MNPEDELGVASGSSVEEDINGNVDKDLPEREGWITFIKREFQAPCLQLVSHYLRLANGNKRKGLGSCLTEFRTKHTSAFRAIFAIDMSFRAIYLVLFLIVAIRALGVENEIKSIFDYVGRAVMAIKCGHMCR